MAACESHDRCRWTCAFLYPPLPVATRADEIFPSAVRHHVEELVGLEKDPQAPRVFPKARPPPQACAVQNIADVQGTEGGI